MDIGPNKELIVSFHEPEAYLIEELSIRRGELANCVESSWHAQLELASRLGVQMDPEESDKMVKMFTLFFGDPTEIIEGKTEDLDPIPQRMVLKHTARVLAKKTGGMNYAIPMGIVPLVLSRILHKTDEQRRRLVEDVEDSARGASELSIEDILTLEMVAMTGDIENVDIMSNMIDNDLCTCSSGHCEEHDPNPKSDKIFAEEVREELTVATSLARFILNNYPELANQDK